MSQMAADNFSKTSCELCNLLYLKNYEKTKVNTLIDNLNAMPFKGEFIVEKHDAITVVTALCLNIKPTDEFIAAKTSHLINSIVTKQNLSFSEDLLSKVLAWHIECLKKCSDVVLPDILHNMQSILQRNPLAGTKFINELIGNQGLLSNLIDADKSHSYSTHNPLQITLQSLKCICAVTSICNEKSNDQANSAVSSDVKERLSQTIISFLLKGYSKTQDEFLYFKVVISALRVLSQLYFNSPETKIPLPEVMGICRHYLLTSLVNLGSKPERIMPSQQTVAPTPIAQTAKGGKKQKLRKHRNNAIESLKKELPVTDRSLMRDVDNFENNSAYKPASWNYLEPQKSRTGWPMTSDSDMSDLESGREVKLIALKARVRQSASSLLLVLVKVTERREMFGYWWALLPDSPDVTNWQNDEAAKKTLAYCAVSDPIASSRASVLSVILALLSGSRGYLLQAEASKKQTTSFIPFSITLGYTITCMHKVLVGILDSERIHSVIIVALKCCAALVQATPYHKMQEGLVSEVVRTTRKFLVHKDITLQVGALITMGCVISIDPKVDEIFKSLQKDSANDRIPSKPLITTESNGDDDCDDFEEGYSDDEMFVVESKNSDRCDEQIKDYEFRSWILDICFRNMGWVFKNDEIVKSKLAAPPIILESLQVLSAMCFHYLRALVGRWHAALGEVLAEMLRLQHQDVMLQAARTLSVLGDAVQKLEQLNQAPPLSQCVSFWETVLPPLSSILQNVDNPSAKAVVCDCIANIGERAFKELPRRNQVVCCTLLVGSCSDAEAAVRGAAVRALAMLLMYRTLREDICFVSDCGENILRALAEPSLVVRTKAAWALGNLSDALVLNIEDPEIDEIDDDLLFRLLEVSVRCADDNDKVKMSATRGLGNLLRLIKPENLARNTRLKPLCVVAIQKLMDCSCKGNNMKVRWNGCYAMGNAMKNQNLFTCFSDWQHHVFSSLCTLTQECKNIKVRINAAVALRSPSAREHYADMFALVWRGVMVAMENAANIDDFNEYKHKDNLIEQLCVTLAHMCCLLKPSDLPDIYDPLVFHYECAKVLSTQLCHKLPPEHVSCSRMLEAAKYVTAVLPAQVDSQGQQGLGMLQEIFIWDM